MLTSHCNFNLSWVKETKQPRKKFKVDWFGGGGIYPDIPPRRYAPDWPVWPTVRTEHSHKTFSTRTFQRTRNHVLGRKPGSISVYCGASRGAEVNPAKLITRCRPERFARDSYALLASRYAVNVLYVSQPATQHVVITVTQPHAPRNT